MSTLPIELYQKIFAELDVKDLYRCQNVCRAWKFAARLIFLKVIKLDSTTHIEQFIRAIDSDPNGYYLNAVKTIVINPTVKPHPAVRLSRETIRKLLFRFPKVEHIHINNCGYLLEELEDQDFSSELLESCHKLECFCPTFSSCLDVWHFRHVLTFMGVYGEIAYGPTGLEKSIQYVSSFPRLQELHLSNFYLGRLESLLHILERLPSLDSITIEAPKDAMDFEERYWSSKSNEDKAKFLERFSKLSKLHLHYHFVHTIGLNTVKFVKDYMTGLTTFKILIYNLCYWRPNRVQKFYSLFDIVDYNACTIYLMGIHYKNLSTFLHIITRKAFSNSGTTSRILCLYVDYPLDNDINLRPHNSEFRRTDLFEKSERVDFEISLKHGYIKVRFPYTVPLQANLKNSFKTRLNNVDVFKLIISNKSAFGHTINIDLFSHILSKMPSLKEATLDIAGIPTYITGAQPTTTLSEMEKLTLRVREDRQINALLSQFCIMYPGLRQLNLHYYCGDWEDTIGEFVLRLGNFHLNTLRIDLTPVKARMEETQQFIIVIVHIPPKMHFFKTCRYLRSITRLSERDLVDIFIGDYFFVRIFISRLEQLELVMYKGIVNNEQEPFHLRNDMDSEGHVLLETVNDRHIRHVTIPME